MSKELLIEGVISILGQIINKWNITIFVDSFISNITRSIHDSSKDFGNIKIVRGRNSMVLCPKLNTVFLNRPYNDNVNELFANWKFGIIVVVGVYKQYLGFSILGKTLVKME